MLTHNLRCIPSFNQSLLYLFGGFGFEEMTEVSVDSRAAISLSSESGNNTNVTSICFTLDGRFVVYGTKQGNIAIFGEVGEQYNRLKEEFKPSDTDRRLGVHSVSIAPVYMVPVDEDEPSGPKHAMYPMIVGYDAQPPVQHTMMSMIPLNDSANSIEVEPLPIEADGPKFTANSFSHDVNEEAGEPVPWTLGFDESQVFLQNYATASITALDWPGVIDVAMMGGAGDEWLMGAALMTPARLSLMAVRDQALFEWLAFPSPRRAPYTALARCEGALAVGQADGDVTLFDTTDHMAFAPVAVGTVRAPGGGPARPTSIAIRRFGNDVVTAVVAEYDSGDGVGSTIVILGGDMRCVARITEQRAVRPAIAWHPTRPVLTYSVSGDAVFRRFVGLG